MRQTWSNGPYHAGEVVAMDVYATGDSCETGAPAGRCEIRVTETSLEVTFSPAYGFSATESRFSYGNSAQNMAVNQDIRGAGRFSIPIDGTQPCFVEFGATMVEQS
jgi:hypothetical protein